MLRIQKIGRSVFPRRRGSYWREYETISNIHGKDTPYEMWKTLVDLFQNNSDHKKLALNDKLQNINMQRNATIPQYLSRFSQCHNERFQVGVIVEQDNLVSLALLGLLNSQHNYQYLVNGRENLPYWECLQFDLVQEEIRQSTRDGT